MTFHFINIKDQSLVFGNFVPFAFATVIAYYQVADRVCVFSSLFLFPLKLFWVSDKTAAVWLLQIMALPDDFCSY